MSLKLEKIAAEREKARRKRDEWEERRKEWDRKYHEQENSEICEMVHAQSPGTAGSHHSDGAGCGSQPGEPETG